MSTTLNITTTYAGEFAGKYISASLLSASTIDDGGVTVLPNVQYKQIIQRLDTDNLIKNAGCDFDPTSTVDMTEVVITPKELSVNLQLCVNDFINTWDAMSMGFGNSQTLPPSFAEYLIAYVASKVASENETTIWQGLAVNNGEYEGLEAIATTCGAITVNIDPPTSTNVIDLMQSVVDAIPNALFGKESLKLYVSNKIAKLYIRSLGGFSAGIGAQGTDNRGTQWFNNDSLSFGGIPVFVARGMSDDKIMAFESTNAYFGCGLLDSFNEIKVLDMRDLDGSSNVRMVMRMKAAVQFGVCADVVTSNVLVP
tara:strand:+ start:11028 stop:11960 length:933 start_codon:yes stop_codon:yes gene_type:complete